MQTWCVSVWPEGLRDATRSPFVLAACTRPEDLGKGLVQARRTRRRLPRFGRARWPRSVKRPCLRRGCASFFPEGAGRFFGFGGAVGVWGSAEASRRPQFPLPPSPPARHASCVSSRGDEVSSLVCSVTVPTCSVHEPVAGSHAVLGERARLRFRADSVGDFSRPGSALRSAAVPSVPYPTQPGGGSSGSFVVLLFSKGSRDRSSLCSLESAWGIASGTGQRLRQECTLLADPSDSLPESCDRLSTRSWSTLLWPLVRLHGNHRGQTLPSQNEAN